jgi:DNA-binding NarL/FixJ family response regulator
MPTPTVAVHDALTGETVVRDMTPEEIAQREADAAAAAAAQAEADAEAVAKAAAREAAINRFKALGFSDAEIAALVLPGA